MNNLWPQEVVDVGEKKRKPPVAILREQARFLEQTTKNLLVAKVRPSQGINDELIYSFEIVAPKLGNYTYQLFYIYHSFKIYLLIKSIC